MAKFCTACGTRNDDSAGFCEECGTALRAIAALPSPVPRNPEAAVVPSTPPAFARWLMPVVLGAVVLVVVAGGLAWWLSPPAAGADAFAAALRGPSGTAVTPSADSLCLANLPYNNPQITVQQYDSTTRRWMDALAAAGLYTPGQPVPGLFQQSIQYTPTEELSKWRRGARLCLGKSWSVSEVKGGRFTPDQRGQHTVYRATVVWKADSPAPWLGQLSDRIRPLPGVTLDHGSLTTESSQVFEVRDRRWVVLTAADQGQIQRESLQTGLRNRNSRASRTDQGGAIAALTNLFSGLGAAHPLVGEWAIDETTPLGILGAATAFKGGRVSFGKDYMESGGERVKARFEVNGDVVNVSAEGETGALQFKIRDKNKMTMNLGLVEIPFNRAR